MQKNDGTVESLDEQRGIDILGNAIEASDLSPNVQFYGSLHNLGHDAISYIHDPENRYLEDYGVMGDVATAMRDPIFYRWHSFIDSLFIRFKRTLQPYTEQQLQNDGVEVQSVKINHMDIETPINQLVTFWQRSEVDLSPGVDFGPNGSTYAQFTHLQHAKFNYQIVINNTDNQRQGTLRIFLLPCFDEREGALPFNDQRLLAIEMDRFTVSCNNDKLLLF